MCLIETRNLSYIYGNNTPLKKIALDNVNISIKKGEIVGIIGHTGSGKSTLAQHLNGLLKPTTGEVIINGKNIWNDADNIRNIRFKVGLVFQYPEYQLFEETVFKDIAFGPINMNLSQEEINRRVTDSAMGLGIPYEMLFCSPLELSGGEKRRVAIAGVLAMKPKVLVLDEPTAGLDPYARDNLMSMILTYKMHQNTTVIIVSHSMEDISMISDRIIVMNEGRVELVDTPKNVFMQHERLEKIGLNVPQVTRIMFKLKEKGLNINANIIDIEQGAIEIIKLLKNRGIKQ